MNNPITTTFTVLIAVGAATSSVYADPKLDTHRPPMCRLITKTEAERYLGKAVHDGVSASVLIDGCSYRAADGSKDGILVTRDDGKYWTYPNQEKYEKLSGIGRKAFVFYQPSIGYDAEGLTQNGNTSVLVVGKYGSDTAVSLLKIAINR